MKFDVTEDYSKWSREKIIIKLGENYKECIGEELDFCSPCRFTEKIQWMKIYYSSPEIVRCIDKISFKDYVCEHLGEGLTAKLYQVWRKPDEVSFEGLPEKCVIKSNCSSEGRNTKLIYDWNSFDKEALLNEIKNNWFDRLRLETNSSVSAYHQVKPAVFVEELIPGCEDAYEYKIFCFNGEPKCMYVIKYNFVDGTKEKDFSVSFYTTDWEFMNCQFGNYSYINNIEKPKKLQQMIDIAKKAAREFMFVRVDFIDSPYGLYLSEFTFYPSAGMIPFHPMEMDYLMGSWLTLDRNFEKKHD